MVLDLGELKRLEELERLNKLENLDTLTQLEQLEKLNQLDRMSQLNKLDGLDRLETLSRLDHLETLNKLETLTQLDQLDKLNNLRFLENLSFLNQITWVDPNQYLYFFSLLLPGFLFAESIVWVTSRQGTRWTLAQRLAGIAVYNIIQFILFQLLAYGWMMESKGLVVMTSWLALLILLPICLGLILGGRLNKISPLQAVER
ncbi:MAG: hypothetical protein KTR14_01295 [Vampirovibrio sp.]|nr:hypothetical protein [Vampirovibrio sp.]